MNLLKPNLESNNPYNILGLPRNATSEDIKKAQKKLSVQYHPDKNHGKDTTELMKKINAACAILSKPEERQKYDLDEDDGDDVATGEFRSLHVGRKLSEELMAKVKSWKKGIVVNQAPFIDFSHSDNNNAPQFDSDHAKIAYQKLLNRPVPSVNDSLANIVSPDIWNWSIGNDLPIKKYILNATYFNRDLSTAKFSQTSNARIDPNEVINVFNFKEEADKFYSIHQETLQKSKKSVESYYGVKERELFPRRSRYDAGTSIPLCSNDLKNTLGFIPTSIVKGSAVPLDTTATNCNGCHREFTLFVRRHTCMKCGTANCFGCQDFHTLPEYAKPVRICNCCSPKIAESYASDWLSSIQDNPSNRRKVTSYYLFLIHELGFAKKEDFLKLIDEFIKDGNYPFALICNHLAKGDWLELAGKLAKCQDFQFAMLCLNKVNKSKKEWTEQARSFASINIYVALFCYQKANLTISDYIKEAFECSDQSIGQACLAMVRLMLQKIPTDKIINLVNQAKIEEAEVLVQCMRDSLKTLNWKAIQFDADKDHLRWLFLSPLQFEIWFDHLIDLLEKSDGKNCIPYFHSHFQSENFTVRRDEFLAKGEHAKALICHRMIPNPISWLELAKKWENKHELAAFYCYLCTNSTLDEIEKLGHSLFKEGKFSLALRCYLHTKAFDLIADKAQAPNIPYEIKLLYQIAMWKYKPDSKNIIFDICQTLLSSKSDQTKVSVQNMMIASFQNLKEGNPFPYHQTLAHTRLLSDLELLGFLEIASQFPKKPQEEVWYKQTTAAVQQRFKQDLEQVIYQHSEINLLLLLDQFNSITLPIVHELLNKLPIDRWEQGPAKSITLLIRGLASWLNPKGTQLFEAMNDITAAMLGNPNSEFLQICSVIIDKIYNNKVQLRGNGMTKLQFPHESKFAKALQRTPDLRLLLKNEKSISQLKPKQAAMAAIDLCMAISNGPALVGGFLNAALELLKVQRTKTKSSSAYAYRRAIVELVATAYTIANRHLCPTTQLYAIRSGIAILTEVFQKSKQVHSFEQDFLKELYNEVDKLSEVVPLVSNQIVSVYDTIYLDLINREFLNIFLPLRRDSEEHSKNTIYQYFIFEGVWNGWMDQTKFDFEVERQRTMQAFLTEKGNTMEQVKDLMGWPGTVRDAEGWFSSKPEPLNLPGQKFSRVEGVRFNLETGETQLLFDSSDDPMKGYFTMTDVTNILQRGITNAQFTLDPDPKFQNSPFQQMLYVPGCLSGTDFLGGMLEVDLLIKMLALKTDIRLEPPFDFRDVEEGLLKRFPAPLQKKFKDLYAEKGIGTAGKICRFWAQAGDLPYFESIKGNEITITFGKCEMSIKKHLMHRDKEGKLIDVEKDEDQDSYEAKIAKLMTDEYDKIGGAFPGFPRLGELAKIQAISRFSQNIYHNKQEQIKNLKNASEQSIKSMLTELRGQIKNYPQATEANVNYILNNNLRDNRGNKVNRFNVSPVELDRLRNQIWAQVRGADQNTMTQIKQIFNKNCYISLNEKNLENAINNWLTKNSETSLVSLLKKSFEAHEEEKISRICRTFKKLSIASECDESLAANPFNLVPAAFRRTNNSKVYGGVNMQANLVRGSGAAGGGAGGGAAGGSGDGGGGGGRGLGPMARYVVSMDQNGRVTAQSYAVNRVTQQAQQALTLQQDIRDNFNQKSGGNCQYYWQSHNGGNVHHYTAHSGVDTRHVHNVSGTTTCINPQGNTVQYSGRGHRCQDNV